jgi:transcriptional regulator with XRE-family HTH domain
MSKIPPRSNRKTPFFALRSLLQMSQPTFARLLGLSFDTVVSIELERAKLTQGVLERLRRETGFVWGAEEGQWVVDPWARHFLQVEKGTPATKELFERFRALTPVSPRLQHVASTAMQKLFKDLCGRVSADHYVEFTQNFGTFMDLCQAILNRQAQEAKPKSQQPDLRAVKDLGQAPEAEPELASRW